MTTTLARPSRWTTGTALTTVALTAALAAFAVARFGSISAALAYVSGDRLLVDAPSKSFGTVDAGTPQSVAFSVTNRSGRPVTILGARSSCGCTVAANLPLTIPDGEARSIEVSITTVKLSGDFAVSIRLYSDAPAHREIALGVRGQIRPVDPRNETKAQNAGRS